MALVAKSSYGRPISGKWFYDPLWIFTGHDMRDPAHGERTFGEPVPIFRLIGAWGAKLVGEMQYENTYRLAYIRGPEGIIVALAEQFG